MNWNPSLLEQINSYRAENGLKALKSDPVLCDAANKRLNEIRTDWSHNGFNADLCTKCSRVGEDLAKGFDDKGKVVSAWIESPSHKEVILTPEYNYGCTVYDRGYAVFEAGAIYQVSVIDQAFVFVAGVIACLVKVVKFTC